MAPVECRASPTASPIPNPIKQARFLDTWQPNVTINLCSHSEARGLCPDAAKHQSGCLPFDAEFPPNGWRTHANTPEACQKEAKRHARPDRLSTQSMEKNSSWIHEVFFSPTKLLWGRKGKNIKESTCLIFLSLSTFVRAKTRREDILYFVYLPRFFF